MKTIAVIPIKKRSERVKGKNFRLIGEKPLYQHLLGRLADCNFDKIYVDSDSEELRDYSQRMGYLFIDRKRDLAENNANGNDLLNYHREIIEAELYFQIFITSPLLKKETINNCIKILENSSENDSILTVKSLYTWFWFEGKPINYDPKILPRSQDAKPVVMETTGLYGITQSALTEVRSRIGKKPYFYEVSDEEAIDLDNEKDFDYLNYYVKNYLPNSND
jgi:CMP-N-acetylneuraminic acid synthetase